MATAAATGALDNDDVFHIGSDEYEDQTEAHTVGQRSRRGARDDRSREHDDDDDDDDDGDGRTVATMGAASMYTAGGTRNKVDVLNVPFHHVVSLMNRILSSKRQIKEKLLQAFWRTVYAPNVSLYPLMRLLLPQLDSDRPTYGLRESTLGDAYIQALGLNKTLDQAQRLKNYKTPLRATAGVNGVDASSGGVSGDFALVLADVLKRYVSVQEGQSRVTIRDVNTMLDQLASDKEKGSATRMAVFTKAVTEMSPAENLYFTRIILKDLKIGTRHESMLKLFDADALDIYNSCSSLKLVCEQVSKPDRAKQAFSPVNYFQPCKPMLASAPPWQSVVSRMKGNPFYIEPKFDGERLLLHKKDGVVKLFTRNSIDYTNRYNYGRTFTPIILQALPKYDCLIDGELLTFDTSTQQYVKFGSNRTIALGGVSALGETRQLCYMAFDILMRDKTVLIDKPLHERRAILHETVHAVPQQFEVIKCRTDVTTSPGLLEAVLEQTAAGMEGVIVKNANSPYLLNDRSDYWVKIKPDYITGLRDNMDLILLGGYYGEGTRRTGGVSHFLLGLLDKQPTPADLERLKDRRVLPPPCYTFCKVGSGYSIPRLRELRAELDAKFQPYDPKNQPKHFMDWKHEKSDIPDVWIDPRDSVIFELKCYEITTCRPNKFTAGYTCRFPRVHQIRSDKDWCDAMTRDDMVKLAEPSLRLHQSALNEAAAGGGGRMNDEDAFDLENDIIKLEARAAGAGVKEESRPVSPTIKPDWRPIHAQVDLSSPQPAAAAAASSYSAWNAPTAAAAAQPYEREDHHLENANNPESATAASAAAVGGAFQWHMGDDHGNVAMLPADGEVKVKGKGKARKRKLIEGVDAKIKKGTVISLFQPTDVSNIGVLQSNIFENKSFCVMSTDKHPNKAELETMIALNGGTFTQNPMSYTFCIIARWVDTIKVSVQREAKRKDIVHYSWLQDCVRAGRLLPLSKQYVVAGTPSTTRALEREVDAFGDSFTQPADADSVLVALTECGAQYTHPFEGGAERPLALRQKIQRSLLDAELNVAKPAPSSYRSHFHSFSQEQQQALLTPVRAFLGFDIWLYGARTPSSTRLALVTLELLGARISEVLHSRVTHILHSDPNDSQYTIDALHACLPGFNLKLIENDEVDMRGQSGACQLITIPWIEQKRQLVQKELMHD